MPPPRFHTVRYFGVLGTASKWRAEVIPAPKPAPEPVAGNRATAPSPPGGGHRSRYRGWAELLERAFAVDPRVCPACGGRMRLLAMVQDVDEIARSLRHLGEPTDPPRRAPARDPPWRRRPVIRHRDPEGPDLFSA